MRNMKPENARKTQRLAPVPTSKTSLMETMIYGAALRKVNLP